MAVGRRFPWLESPHNVALLSMSDMRVSQNLQCLLGPSFKFCLLSFLLYPVGYTISIVQYGRDYMRA